MYISWAIDVWDDYFSTNMQTISTIPLPPIPIPKFHKIKGMFCSLATHEITSVIKENKILQMSSLFWPLPYG